MKKYILISLVLHLIILFGFGVMQTTQLEKNEPKNQVVPIAFVAKQTSKNPGSKVLDTEEREKQSPEPPKPKVEKKQEEKKSEEKKVEKKPEKKEIESNIPSKMLNLLKNNQKQLLLKILNLLNPLIKEKVLQVTILLVKGEVQRVQEMEMKVLVQTLFLMGMEAI